MQLFARATWLLVPKFLRITCYLYLLNKGESTYGHDISEVVQQLPLGLYAKRCDRTQDNEPNALRLLEKNAPSIPAPLLIDSFQDADVDWFIMTKLPGVRVHDVLHRMSYSERDQLAADISHVLTQMHNKIRNTTPYQYANVSGGPIHDRRLGFDNTGPFNSDADLNARMSCGIQTYLTKQVPTAFSRSHASVFTHGDLFFSNVLVDGGRLSGIVDWEGACFMPEYWEFTKAMRTARSEEARAVYRRVWGDRFDVELETERWLWNAFPFGG
jgi:aminoglycoside phosphotransferase (APT) family kinase protein